MKNKQIISATILAGFIIGLPFAATAAVHLVPCENDCDFNQLMIMANRIINFLLYSVMVPLIALGFMYVGARLVLFQEKEAEWTKAKESFLVMAQGVFIIISAFILIKFVLFQFLNTDAPAGGGSSYADFVKQLLP